MSLKDYIQGKRHGKEANKLERKAMDDAFLQDALEGFDAMKGDHLPVVEELEKQVAAQKSTKKITPVWRWAAAVIAFLLIGTSMLYIFNTNNQNLPQTADVKKPQVKIPTAKPIDTLIVADKIEIKTTKKRQKKEKITSIKQDKVKSAINKGTLEELPVIGYNSSINSNRGYADASTTIRANELGLGTLPDSTNDLFGYLPQTDSKIDLNDSNRTITGLATQKSEVDDVLQDKIAGISVSSKSKKSNEIQIRGISSIKNDNIPIKLTQGRILDENNEPIIGASIMLKGTTVGVTTDYNGEFMLPLIGLKKDSTLVVSYIGYEREEIPIKENVGDVKLLTDNKILDEVVTIGYGTKKNIFTKPYSYSEKEFIKYFKKNYDKSIICEETKITIEATFTLDENGHPTEITEIKTNCSEMEKEVKKWLEKSPSWTKKDKKITLKFSIKQ